jgi:hypothetical protein
MSSDQWELVLLFCDETVQKTGKTKAVVPYVEIMVAMTNGHTIFEPSRTWWNRLSDFCHRRGIGRHTQAGAAGRCPAFWQVRAGG